MNGIRLLVEGYLDLNIAMMFALVLWCILRAAMARTPWASAYGMQRRLLGWLLLAVLLSPLLAAGVTALSAQIWPRQSLALSDLVVAAFLDGRIAMPAVTFEEMLTTRKRWVDALLAADGVAVQAFWALLATGVTLMLARLAHAAWAVHQTLRAGFLWRSTARVDIRLSDTVAMPFAVRGLRRYHVVLPSSLVTRPGDMALVLAHEFLHIRKGDTELELVAELLRPFFFWNPAFRIWKGQLEQLRELSCDQLVVSRCARSPKAYMQCLLTLCATAMRPEPPQRIRVGFVQSSRAKRDLLRRFRALCSDVQSPPRVPMPALAGLTLGLFGLVAVGAAALHPVRDWSQDRLMLSTVVNLERLEAINRGF